MVFYFLLRLILSFGMSLCIIEEDWEMLTGLQ